MSELILTHSGVKGMKWGVRKSYLVDQKTRYNDLRTGAKFNLKTKHGETVDVSEQRNLRVISFFASLSPGGYQYLKSMKAFKFSVNGTVVGNASFKRVNSDELHLNWLGVKKSERGKGYGSAVFDAAVKYGKESGCKKLTLEVPGSSPDAKHIYEKRGFVAGKMVSWEDDLWGGLTEMTLDLANVNTVKHSGEDFDNLLEEALTNTFKPMPLDVELAAYGEDSPMTDNLSHSGVKGMKWGVRKNPIVPSSDHTNVRELRKKRVPELSNAQLKTINERMQLEVTYSNLKTQQRPSWMRKTNDIITQRGATKAADAAQSATTKLIAQMFAK